MVLTAIKACVYIFSIAYVGGDVLAFFFLYLAQNYPSYTNSAAHHDIRNARSALFITWILEPGHGTTSKLAVPRK